MLSLQTFGAPQLQKHVERMERVQQTNRAQGARLAQPAAERCVSSKQQGTILPDQEPVSRPLITPYCSRLSRPSWGSVLTALHIADSEFCNGITLCI